MAEKVEENKRVKVSDRSVGSTELFKNKNLSPTVGAGGQYNVQVEQPQQSAFSRLAEGLSTMNTALQAVGESDIAASDQAIQKASEMTLEQAQAAAVELKDAEDGMYKSGGFVDRLTRRGEVSNTENFLNFPRAQRALGHKLGAEGYTKRATMALKEAQEAFKTQGTEYDAAAIMEGIRNDMGEEFGMDDSFSTKQGFDNAVGKFTAEQISRDFDQKNKVSRVHNITRASDEMSAIFAGHATSSDEQLSTRLSEMAGRYNNLTVGDSAAAMRMALSTLADRDPLGAQRAINMQRDGVLRDINMGGVPLSSAAFEATRDAIESELESIENKAERESNVSVAKVKQNAQDAKQAVSTLDFSEPKTLGDLGFAEGLLTDEQATQTYSSEVEMQEGLNKALISNAKGNEIAIRSAISGYDSNTENRSNNKQIMQANSASRMENQSSRVVSNQRDNIVSEMKALAGSGISTRDVRAEYNRGVEERHTVGTTGNKLDGTPVLINEEPFLSDATTDAERQAWFTAHTRDGIEKQSKLIADAKAKNAIKMKQDKATEIEEQSSEAPSKKIKTSYLKIKPNILFTKDLDSDWTWSLAKIDSQTKEGLQSEKQLRHPSNRSNGISYIAEIERSKKRRVTVDDDSGMGNLFGLFSDEVEVKPTREDIDKFNNLGLAAFKRVGVTYDELSTLSAGKIVLEGGTTITITDDILRSSPMRGFSDAEYADAVRIINEEFGGDITVEMLKETANLDMKLSNLKTQTE